MAVGFWFNAGMESSAEVHINENGTVQVVELVQPELLVQVA